MALIRVVTEHGDLWLGYAFKKPELFSFKENAKDYKTKSTITMAKKTAEGLAKERNFKSIQITEEWQQ